jgi:cytochrome P450
MALPPGPDGSHALRVLRWLQNPYGLLDDCHRRYGDAFTLKIFGYTLVVVSDPAVVKQAFTLSADDGHAGEGNWALKPFLGRHSLILLDGEEHARQRKMILPAFHGERMHAFGRTMLDLANESIDRWPVGASFALHQPMQAITLQLILRTVFGVQQGPRLTALSDTLKRALDLGSSPWMLLPFLQKDLGPLSPWGRFQRYRALAREILRDEIRKARTHGTQGRTDVLAMMVEARDEAGHSLTEDEIHDELITLLIAGHETTTTSLTWALRWILLDAQLVGRLRAEIATAAGDPTRIAKLELLDATVKEALRLQPIFPLVMRLLKKPAILGPLELPAGVALAPSAYLVHRRPSLYPDPERFQADRFLSFKPSPWEWLPFGGGLRRCVGAAFAQYEMKMVLAAMLPRVDARPATDDIRPIRRGITVAPSRGMPILVTARRSREILLKTA